MFQVSKYWPVREVSNRTSAVAPRGDQLRIVTHRDANVRESDLSRVRQLAAEQTVSLTEIAGAPRGTKSWPASAGSG